MNHPDTPLAIKQLRSHERFRFGVRLDDPDLQRQLDNSLQACQGTRLSYTDVLERITDFGVPILRPRLREKKKLPEMWVDEVTRQPLPNIFGTERERQLREKIQTLAETDPNRAKAEKELHAIRSEQIALSKSNPDLADHLKAMAYRPWQHQIALREAECERLEANQREQDYFANAKKHETGGTDWIREWCGNDVEKAKIVRRESQPIDLEPILSPRREKQDRTLLGRISREDPQLYGIICDAQQREAAYEELQHEAEQQRQQERVLAAKAMSDALLDAKHRVTRTRDGRVITQSAGAK